MTSDILRTMDLTFRIFVLVAAILIGGLVVLLGSRQAMAATLKPAAIVTGNVFTVGDLFSGLSEDKASHVLGATPQPGSDMVLNARTLMRIAIAMDLPWRPASTMDQIVIRRDAVQIGSAEIHNVVAHALADKGIQEKFAVTFFGNDAPTMVLPTGYGTNIEIANLNYDRQNDRFDVHLAAPSKDKPMAEMTLSGKIERLIPVPVMKTTLSRGDIIGATDVEWLEVRNSELQDDIVMDAQDLIGMAPRRMILSGKAIRRIDLEYPQLVSRGQTVTIAYNNGTLNLSAKGKAMQNGAKGDIVRVVNLGSKRSIEGMVTSDGTVTVSP